MFEARCSCGQVIRAMQPMTVRCRTCRKVLSVPGDMRPTDEEYWPRWARMVRRLRKADDAGVGDTVERLAARVGGERFKAFSERRGIPCGCTARRDEWNRLYPYSATC